MSEMNKQYIAKMISVNGIVQGVGFRPFAYQLACKYFLMGNIANTSDGVSIHVEGEEDAVDNFLKGLISNPPPLAKIDEVLSFPDEVKGYNDFLISKSTGSEKKTTLISPDVSICDDCLRELYDPDNRRYRYPFINCTNCGPRYTIIDEIPYDRPNTSMKKFRMCEKCRTEYDDPSNRRFHAQPNACDACGPHVRLYDNKRNMIHTDDPVMESVSLLKQGCIVAIKGLGGFHLAVDAEDSKAVITLRKRKLREEKPFAVMSPGLEQISEYAFLNSEEESFLKSKERPIILLKKKGQGKLSEWVSPRNKYYGVMLPYTPLHYLILKNNFRALVMTSGNVSEEPISIENEDAFHRLSNIADYFLIHDRDIYLRSDDSIINPQSGKINMIRRSRGYVPVPVLLKDNNTGVLGCGAELKNTICITKKNKAFLSQHIGDLESRATFDFFKKTVNHMKRILDIEPEIVGYDLHPDYMSTRFALEQENVHLVSVQHHHAHIASCMAENGIDGDVIGLSFDGTGYGPDGSIWGGEILIADFNRYKRISTISPVAMPGSASAIKEPWKMGVSYLFKAFGKDLLELDIPLIKKIPESDINIIIEMVAKKINSPLTTSLGRLFDGVSAICGIRTHVYNEGQAAMELEMAAGGGNIKSCYNSAWERDNGIYLVNPATLVREIVNDILDCTKVEVISEKFHRTLINIYSELCRVIALDTGLDRVVLSGGVFQNIIFTKGLVSALEDKSLKVYTHRLVPSNDGGISLGQAVIAAACSN